MDQVQLFGIGKRVKTKIQKYIGAICYVCRNYRRKTGRRGLFGSLHPE